MPKTPLLFLNKEETIPEPQKRNLPETFFFKTPLPFKLKDLKWGGGEDVPQLMTIFVRFIQRWILKKGLGSFRA